MFREQARLRDQIVFLEVAEGHHVEMNAWRYLWAARTARVIVSRELGEVQMRKFVLPALPALQTTAENIYFESYGCFADLDGSGHAAVAAQQAERLLERLRGNAHSR
ncbi:hypothetical protein [Piscinibacter sp. HJYY11]|uniref:hypothetical protein n=1 Tax=Piscinibacter sp. HJYY11 TaxID=2801333 RepID=UPI00191DF4EC|nr:hypothetical protein [Piscinibacter sp. HJYY11]MBL0730044.1 hypothetical protein [Piscinibacter sp. HJYY11]